MKPGWVRRRGFDLMALSFGGSMLLFWWDYHRGTMAGLSETWAIALVFWLGVILAIFGGARRKHKASE